MRKILFILFILFILSVSVAAVNYDYIYSPYTGKRDRSVNLNQTGNNITADYFFGNGSFLELDGVIDTNETDRVDALELANVSTNLRITNLNNTLQTDYYTIVEIELMNSTLSVDILDVNNTLHTEYYNINEIELMNSSLLSDINNVDLRITDVNDTLNLRITNLNGTLHTEYYNISEIELMNSTLFLKFDDYYTITQIELMNTSLNSDINSLGLRITDLNNTFLAQNTTNYNEFILASNEGNLDVNSSNHLNEFNTSTLANDDEDKLTVKQSWLESLFYTIVQIEVFNTSLYGIFYTQTEIELMNNTLTNEDSRINTELINLEDNFTAENASIHSNLSSINTGIANVNVELDELENNFTAQNDSNYNEFVNISGDTMTGNLIMEGNNITNITYCGIGIDEPEHNLDIVGDLLLTHVATSSDEHGLELKIDANGIGDVKGIDLVFDTGAISTGQDEEAILINIDTFDSSGGSVAGVEVIRTGNTAEVHALLTGVEVDPVLQLSGTFEDMDSVSNDGVDNLADFISLSSNVSIFVSDNDYVTIGNLNHFEEIEFILQVESSKNIKPTFEFSTGVGSWDSFTPTDGTNGLENSGVVIWENNDIPSWVAGAGGEYLIRITRTRNNIVTIPVEGLVQLSDAIEYIWNKDGDVRFRNVNATIFNGNVDCSWFTGNTSDLCALMDTDTTCDSDTCDVINTGTLDGYEASDLLDDTNSNCSTSGSCSPVIYEYDYLALLDPFYKRGTFDASVHNFLANGEKRFGIDLINFYADDTTGERLFDGNYETLNYKIANYTNATIMINLTEKGEYNVNGLTYPQGFMIVSFYFRACPSAIYGQVLRRDAGWGDFTSITELDNPLSSIYCQYKLVPPSTAYLQLINITIEGGEPYNPEHAYYNFTLPTEIAYYLTRPALNPNSVFTQYRNNNVYNDFIFKDSNNLQTAMIDASTGAITSTSISTAMSCTNITGATSDLCTLVDSDSNLTEFDVEQYIFDDGIHCGNLTGNSSDLCTLVDTDSDSNLTGADIVSHVGNWSSVKSDYYNITEIEVMNSSLRTDLADTNESDNVEALLVQNTTTVKVGDNISSNYVTDTPSQCSTDYYTTGFGPNNFSQMTCTYLVDTDSNLTGADIVSHVGNWSSVKSDYYNITEIEVMNSSLRTDLADTNETTNVETLLAQNVSDAISFSSDNLSGNLTWLDLYGFPAACPANSYVTQIRDSITCIELIDTDSNLTESDVDSYVANNGYVTENTNCSVNDSCPLIVYEDELTYTVNTDTQDLSYTAATDVIDLVDGGSIDISEVDTTCEGDLDCRNIIYHSELNTFAELQSQIPDETLIKAGTLTNGKMCKWSSVAGDVIICNYDAIEEAEMNTLAELNTQISSTLRPDTNCTDSGDCPDIIYEDELGSLSDLNTQISSNLFTFDSMSSGKFCVFDGSFIDCDVSGYTGECQATDTLTVVNGLITGCT